MATIRITLDPNRPAALGQYYVVIEFSNGEEWDNGITHVTVHSARQEARSLQKLLICAGLPAPTIEET